MLNTKDCTPTATAKNPRTRLAENQRRCDASSASGSLDVGWAQSNAPATPIHAPGPTPGGMVSTAPKITLNTVSPTTMKATNNRYPMLRSRRMLLPLAKIEANDSTVTATSTTYAIKFEPSMPKPNRTFHGSNAASKSNTAPQAL